MLLTGLRGVGKTVLLNQIERMALDEGYHAPLIEAHENKRLALLIVPPLRKILFDLDRIAGAGEKVKRGLAVLKSFMNGLKITLEDITVGLGIEPETGAADSGDLELDLPNLMVAVGEAAEHRGTAVAILIDEVQYFAEKELGALIMAMHRVQQRQLPITLIGAGLPILPRLAGESKSYAERLFDFPQIGALSPDDAAKALQEPARNAGVSFENAALDEVYHLTKGYPYFLQEWGYHAWNSADSSPITQRVVQHITPEVKQRLDQSFFRVRFDRLTPAEKTLLRAMAELGNGPYRTADVAQTLNVKLTSLGPRRAKLIQKGMIYSPSHGELAFTVPLFDEFMIRAIPEFERK